MTPQRLGYAAWAALLVLQFAWYLWLAPPGGDGAAMRALVLTVPPLLLPLAAFANPRRMLLWIGIVSLFYFAHGIVAGWVSPGARGPALLEVLVCVVLVGAIGWDTRRRKRAAAPG